MKGGDSIKRIVHSRALASKWMSLGYKIVALSYTGCFGETPLAFHLEKEL
nr:MAG TPA: GTP Cyclohydrolase I [Caudoviricetes sp.]